MDDSRLGAKTISCGWFSSLRQFSIAKFENKPEGEGGGRQARARYTSIPLLNSILVIPELQTIHDSGLVNKVLTNTSYDSVMQTKPGDASWPKNVKRNLFKCEGLKN